MDKTVPFKTFVAIQDAAAGAKLAETLRIERVRKEENVSYDMEEAERARRRLHPRCASASSASQLNGLFPVGNLIGHSNHVLAVLLQHAESR
jgi:hypothetical protein